MPALPECFVAPRARHFSNILSVSKPLKKKCLPKPDGPLACLTPSSTIDAANSAVHEIFC